VSFTTIANSVENQSKGEDMMARGCFFKLSQVLCAINVLPLLIPYFG
jgi:hypothetical protein